MDLGLRDKVAVVTGASRGIGRAIAFALASEGVALALCSRSEKEIRETAEKISSLHRVRIHAEPRDLVFLASDKCDFINGVSIEVDGALGRCLTLEIK